MARRSASGPHADLQIPRAIAEDSQPPLAVRRIAQHTPNGHVEIVIVRRCFHAGEFSQLTLSPAQKITYDLRAPQDLRPASKALKGRLAIPERDRRRDAGDAAVFVRARPGLSRFRRYVLWADSIPNLLQARLIEGFENYDIAHAPLRIADLGQTDFQLLIDVRRFRIATDPAPTAEIGLSARIVDKTGKVVASRLFEDGERFDKIEPPAAAAAFSDAFGRIAKDMIAWTVEAL